MASKIATFAARAVATGAIGVVLLTGASTASASASPMARGTIGVHHSRQHCSYHKGYYQRYYQRGYWGNGHRWHPARWDRRWHAGYWHCDR